MTQHEGRGTDASYALCELRVERASTFWSRLKGLMGRRSLGPNQGLFIAPCNSVHTAFMRFPIDLVFIDRKGEVLQVTHHLQPWRVATCLKAAAVLELRSGGALARRLEAGIVLRDLMAHGASKNIGAN